MTVQISNSRRIAKNSFFLYIRMLLIMLVTLYISRIVLETLGADDYGLYSVVGGIVVLFTFLNTSMISATQRFLNYEMGSREGSSDSIKKVFSMSLNCHCLIALLILILGETIGFWFLNSYINIPEDRIMAANWVYQFSLITTCLNVVLAPFNAAIIACEKMSIYAYISIVEVLLKLAVAFSITFIPFDKLISYGLLLTIVTLIICFTYIIYCADKISFCCYKFCWNTSLFKNLISFSGWSLLGGMSNIGQVHGINIIVNMFFGVTVNAAMGIANQVNSALTMFVNNFATAFNPQIIKTFSSGEKDNFFKLLHNTSRYCYLLYFIICLPILFFCDTILQIWLKEIPEDAALFCRLVILVSLVDSINTPLWTSVRAHGEIKKYNIVTSVLRISTLPICFLGFKYGLSPCFSLITNLLLNIVIQMWIVHHVKELIGLDINRHLKVSLLPCFLVTIISLPLPILIKYMTPDHILKANVLSFVGVVIITFVNVWFIGVRKNERNMVLNFIKHKLNNETN